MEALQSIAQMFTGIKKNIIFNTSIAIKTNHQDRIRPEEAKADTGVYPVRKHGNILDLFRTENTF